MLQTCGIGPACSAIFASHKQHALITALKNLLCLCSAVVDVQNKLTNDVLEQCKTRGAFKELLTKVFNYPRFSCPFKRGNRCGQQSDACPEAGICKCTGQACSSFGCEKHIWHCGAGTITPTTQGCRRRACCTPRPACRRSQRSSWTPTSGAQMALLRCVTMRSPRMANTWHTALAGACIALCSCMHNNLIGIS